GTLTLTSIEVANLTGGGGDNVFTVTGWTGSATLTGGGGADTLVFQKDANFTLTDTSLSATGGPSLTLAGIGTANLTGGTSANTFTVTGWTGGGMVTGGGGSDTVVLTKDADFTLTDASLSATGGPSLALAGVGGAHQTRGAGGQH